MEQDGNFDYFKSFSDCRVEERQLEGVTVGAELFQMEIFQKISFDAAVTGRAVVDLFDSGQNPGADVGEPGI
jgi:hypothetical protein